MKSVVIHAEGNVCVEERPIPTLQTENDVLVKVVSSGLCGSDIPRIFAKGAHYYPITLGHEFSGYVESYGAAVTDLQPGDAVACVPLLPCFQCPQCSASISLYVNSISSSAHAAKAATPNMWW